MPILSFKDINIKAKCIYSSKDFFNIFSFNLIEGNASQVLADQNSIVISEKLALELFNTTKNVIGNSIELGHNKSFLVTGVFSNVPPNSSLQFDFVLSYEELRAYHTSSFF